MTIFGLNESEVAVLLRAVMVDQQGEQAGRDELEVAFARATWSGIAEPGDGDGGAIIAALGPVAALAAVIDHADAAPVASRCDLEVARVKAAFDRWQPRVSSSASTLALRQAARFGVRLLIPESPHWPAGMDDLGRHAPVVLWIRGRPEAIDALGRSVSIVGARAATAYGEHVTGELSAGLVDRGFAVVSGGAYGIDGMAHRAALASDGTTVAFLAGGPDRFYPSGHDGLLTRIADRGAVITELPCGSSPTKWRFLQRNRLIAAAGNATVVVEAGARSGSLNTAHHAAELGRAIGAVPGPVTSPASAGCHRLLREGPATCVTNPDEVLELVLGPQPEQERARYDPATTRVLDALSPRSSRQVADIARRAGLSERESTAVLGREQLAGAVQLLADGWRRVR